MRCKCRYCGKVRDFVAVTIADGDDSREIYDAHQACPARLVQGCEPSERDLKRRKALADTWLR